MKRIYLTVILLLLAAVLLAVAMLFRRSDGTPTRGGIRTDNTDPDAPKAINSTEIISFECSFSTLRDLDPGKLGKRFCSFQAARQNGSVIGSYRSDVPSSPELSVKCDFKTDASFMAKLQDAVSNHGISRHNGLSVRVSGLPSKLGAKLYIVYASGETVSASNNQTNFLSSEEMEAIEAVFRQAAFGEGQNS